MSIYYRNGIWYVALYTPSGQRIRRSTGTTNKTEAQELHDKLKYELWRSQNFKEKPKVLWDEACLRWLDEKRSKRSISDDKGKMRCLKGLRGLYLHQLTKPLIMAEISKLKCSNATKNRYIALIKAILNKCVRDWEWLDTAPKLPSYTEAKKRIRWLTQDEAQRLLNALPEYIAQMALFSLNTGLRQSNVFNLKWQQIDLQRRTAWIYHDEAKAGKAIGIALNQTAMDVLASQLGKHRELVFITPHGKPVKRIEQQWKKALAQAQIDNFRWHDLRHTWASWLVQSGVPLYALKEMGGWESMEMVQRYAHLAPEHLHRHANVLDSFVLTKPTVQIAEKDTN